MRIFIAAIAVFIAAFATQSFAQGASIAFGNIKQDTSAPVEVSADNMAINQASGTATLTGNVLIGQGAMRLAASQVNIVYSADRKQIAQMKATGGVTLASGDDAAEAQSAEYNIDSGLILLSGNVLLVQGNTAITADKMRVDTKAGTARMEGRVKTVLNVEN